jgi:hypothetical protein
MENWDEEAADLATAALVRSMETQTLFELFARYGCRDFRDIGHKAIFVANSFRALEVIGWQHAEPVLRSLTYGLLHHEGDNPAKRDGEPDRSGRRSLELAKKINGKWDAAKPTDVTEEILVASRTTTDGELSELVTKTLNSGVAPRSIWGGLFVSGGELLMRQPGIVALHTLTSLNALHYTFRQVHDENLQKILLLQAASFVPLFREAMKSRGKVAEAKIDTLQPRDEDAEFTAQAVYEELSRNKERAARTALSVCKANPSGAKEVIDAGRQLIFLKGTDSHDYKFSSAVMEDYAFINPAWRDRFLAASLYWLKGSGSADVPLVKRTRAALA